MADKIWLLMMCGPTLGLTLVLIPSEKFFNHRLAAKLEKIFQRIAKIFNRSNASLIQGRRLLFMFSELELSANSDMARLEKVVRNLPSYKLFDIIAQSLFKNFRQFGYGLEDLSFLRECLATDLKMEERCQRILKNSRSQFVILGVFSLGISIFMHQNMNSSAGSGSFLLGIFICSIQIVGVIAADFITRIAYKKYFNDVDEWFHTLLKLQSIVAAGGELATEVSKIVRPIMRRSSRPDVKELGSALGNILDRWRQWGGDLTPEMRGLLRFLHEIRENRFYQFERFLTVLNFTLMAILFLGGHLVHLAALFTALV